MDVLKDVPDLEKEHLIHDAKLAEAEVTNSSTYLITLMSYPARVEETWCASTGGGGSSNRTAEYVLPERVAFAPKTSVKFRIYLDKHLFAPGAKVQISLEYLESDNNKCNQVWLGTIKATLLKGPKKAAVSIPVSDPSSAI